MPHELPIRRLASAVSRGHSDAPRAPRETRRPWGTPLWSMPRLLAAAAQGNTREADAEKEECGGLRYSRRRGRRDERAVRTAQAGHDIRVVEEQGAVGGIRRGIVTAGAARCDRREGVLHGVDQVDVAEVRVGDDEPVELPAA